jgi:hypothetical protein
MRADRSQQRMRIEPAGLFGRRLHQRHQVVEGMLVFAGNRGRNQFGGDRLDIARQLHDAAEPRVAGNGGCPRDQVLDLG